MSRFTENQQKVIDINSGNVVVSASAGSGKTSVMIERIIRLIIEGKADISEILAVTYTKASAKEIKDRITKAIKDKIASGINKELFIKQIEKLPTCSISTIHSFCADIIRTYFYVAEVDPTFTVLDGTGEEYLKNRALDDLFEKLYDDDDSDIVSLLDIFIRSRSDKEFKKHVLDAFKFANYEEDFDLYFENALSFYCEDGFENAENQLIGEYIRLLRGLAETIENLREYSLSENVIVLADFFDKYLQNYKEAVLPNDITVILDNISKLKGKRPSVEKNETNDRIIKEYDNCKKELNDLVKEIAEFFGELKDVRLEKTLQTHKFASSFVKIVKLFKERYDRLKQDICVLDFNDLEHYTLKILKNEEILQEISSRYKYIFVDEYQDVNGAQEGIFRKISKNNLFIVGDVKQSIYAFRGCNPNIFNKKIKDCKNGYGEHIDLDANFRSAIEIINATNRVFSGSMRESTSGLEYKKTPMKGGSLYGENAGEVTLHIVPKKEKETVEINGVYGVKKHVAQLESKKVDTETKLICDIIEDELTGDNGLPRKIFDVKTQKIREVTYGDICLLTRAKKGISDRVVSELVARGVPVICENDRSIGEYPEIKVMVNLLEHIVNPTKDIPLASVLKSEIGGLGDDELSLIRQENPQGIFYDACKNYCKKYSDEISQKLNDFFEYFEKVRIISQFDTASRVLKMITSERGYEIKLLAGKLGEIKLQRINRFILAGEKLTVFEMLNQIDSIVGSLTVNQASGGNAVRVMSYHLSKGLEFPIVILADISKRFNNEDLKKEIYFDREFGFSIKYYDVDNKICQPTSLRRLMTLKKKYSMATEELRLFYVAMTRARYRLHLVSAKLPGLFHSFSSYALATQMIDFIALDDLNISLQIDALNRQALTRRQVILGEADLETTQKISELINFEYPFIDDTTLYLKRTVTEVNSKKIDDFDGVDFYTEEKVLPVISDRENLQAIGTSYHRYLETCDFEKTPDNELIRLLNEKLLTKEQFDLINVDTLKKILSLDIFEKIKGFKLYREQPFILDAPANLVADAGSDTVLLQGVIDLLAINGDYAYVIDYKYSSKSDDKLIETYKKQLDLYAYATESVLKKTVKGKYIVNLKAGKVILVD